MKVTIEISEQLLKDLKRVRNYFVTHSKTVFEHSAYDIINNMLKIIEQNMKNTKQKQTTKNQPTKIKSEFTFGDITLVINYVERIYEIRNGCGKTFIFNKDIANIYFDFKEVINIAAALEFAKKELDEAKKM